MSSATVSLLVLAASVALFVWNRLPVGIVAIATALALYFTGVLDVATALSGFGDPVVIFIATLFVVSEGLEASGVTAWAGQVLTQRAGTKRSRLLIAVMALAAVLSAFITPNGAAAALLPVTVVVARRASLLPSKMLIPLAFAASAGALLTLSGSPVNVIVAEASQGAGGPGFGYFEFAIMGLPLVVCTTLLALVLGNRLLPERVSTSLPADFSEYLGTVVDHYGLEKGVYRLRVRSGSALRDSAIADLALGGAITLIGVQDAGGQPATPEHEMQPGDVLVVTGPGAEVTAFATDHGLRIAKTLITRKTRAAMLSREAGVAEFVIPPRSGLIGSTMFPGMARTGGLVVLAIRRLGKDRGARPTELAEGDTVLIHGRWSSIEALGESRDVLVVDSPDMVRRQTVPLGRRAPQALCVLVRDGRVAGDRGGSAGRGRAAGGGGHGAAAGGRSAGGVSRGVLADGGADRRSHPAVDRHSGQRGGGPGRGTDRRHRRRPGALRPDAGPVCADRGARADRQQHRHRVDRGAHRAVRGGRDRHLGAAGVDAGGGGRRRLTADPDRHPGEHDGDGAWRVPVRGLLEVRPGHHDRLARTGHAADSVGLAVLLMPGANRQ